MIRSLRARLLLALLFLLACAAVVMGSLAYRNTLEQAEALFDYQLRQMALSLRDQGEVAAPGEQLLSDERLDFVIQIWSRDGRVIYASQAHEMLPNRAQLGYADIRAGSQLWRTYGVATPGRVIQVAQPEAVRRRMATDSALRSVTPLLLLAPLLALAAWWLAIITLRPLQRMATEVHARDAASLQPIRLAGLPGEIAPLAQALNDLLDRLSTAWQAQRSFVADAAHELRSPLTALKLQLHLLRNAHQGPQREAALDDLAQGIERASRLVEQLLLLARNEPDAPAQAMQALDLDELVRREVASLAPMARVKRTDVELLSSGPLEILGHAPSLASLVRNLVENAIQHSPAGARVQVQLGSVAAPDGTMAPTLVVEDSGPGIPTQERERAFDRFYRRAGTDVPGSGLGLAIVRAVAERHQARVGLDASALGGLRVTVRFGAPTAADSASDSSSATP